VPASVWVSVNHLIPYCVHCCCYKTSGLIAYLCKWYAYFNALTWLIAWLEEHSTHNNLCHFHLQKKLYLENGKEPIKRWWLWQCCVVCVLGWADVFVIDRPRGQQRCGVHAATTFQWCKDQRSEGIAARHWEHLSTWPAKCQWTGDNNVISVC